MFVEEQYNEKHKYDYFAMKYLVKVNYDKTNKKNVEQIFEFEPLFIRKSYEWEKDGVDEIFCTDDGELQERFMILPTLLRNGVQERDVLYISASAGSGKSYFLNKFCEIYHMYYPQNTMYFLTCNDFKQDISLNHDLYKPLEMNEFIETIDQNQEEIAKNGKIFANSLMVFDDIGVVDHDKKKQKAVYQFVNTALENCRKRKLSLICVSHVPTNYRLTTVLVRETQWYVIFPSNQQCKSDRFLNSYLGLSKKQVNRITDVEDKSRWVAINTKSKIVVTEYKIYGLKEKLKA